MASDDPHATKFTPLSFGVLDQIMTGSDVDKPIFQILGTRRIGSGGGNDGQERFRLLISDGVYLHSFAMLATQINHMQADGSLSEFTIVRVNRYITSMVNQAQNKEKRVIILLDMDILHKGEDVQQKLHNPQQYSGSGNQSENVPPSNQMQQNRPSISNGSAYGNSSAQNNRPPASLNASMNRSLNEALTHPISSLSPYQNKWVIKARCTSKSAVRTWSNAKGEGKLFSMDWMDESGEIRATAFRDQVDKFYDMIEVDKVYYISKCQLKPANKQYTTIKNDYEMTLNNDTIIQECEEEVTSIPQMHFDLVKIGDLAEMEPNKIVDILAVVKEYSEVQELKSRATGRDLIKRDITLVDQSNASIVLTLWGDEAKNFDGYLQPVLLIKGARVSEFGGGKTLSTISSTVTKHNPDIPEGHRLRGWFDNGGADNVSASLSARTGVGAGGMPTEWMTFYEAKERNLGSGDKPDYFQLRGFTHNMKASNSVYKACPQAECNKKVVDQENGNYRCEKCNADFPNFKYRLLCNMLIGDWTGNRWCTVFSDVAENLLGKSSQDVGEAIERGEGEEIFTALNFKSYIFKFRTKVEIYGDVPRNKTSVISAAPINYKEYNAMLISKIQEATGVGVKKE